MIRRFFKKEYDWDWWFIFDKQQKYTHEDGIILDTDEGDYIPMSEGQVVDLLNNLYNYNLLLKHEIKKLKGV